MNWGGLTKEERVKRMTVEDVDSKLQGIQLEIDAYMASQHRDTTPNKKSQWYNNNEFWKKKLAKKLQEKEDWEKVKQIKLGATEESLEDNDEEDEEEQLDQTLEDSRQSIDISGNYSDDYEEDGVKDLETEMEETFQGIDPELVYETERQELKDWDKIYGEIDEAEAKGLGIDWNTINKALEEDNTWYIKNNEIKIRTVDEKTGKKRTINWDKKLARIEKTKKRLEEKIAKKAKRLKRMGELIEANDEKEKWNLWYKHVTINMVNDIRGSSGGNIIKYNV